MKLLKLLFLCLTILSMSIISGCGSDSNSPAKPAPQKQEFTGSWIGLTNDGIQTLKIEKLGEQQIVTAVDYSIYHDPIFKNETNLLDVTLYKATQFKQRKATVKNNQLNIPDTKGFFVLENGSLKGKAKSNDNITTYEKNDDAAKEKVINKLKEAYIQEVKKVGQDVNRLNFKTLTKDQIKE